MDRPPLVPDSFCCKDNARGKPKKKRVIADSGEKDDSAKWNSDLAADYADLTD
jgi:hypothetical protein